MAATHSKLIRAGSLKIREAGQPREIRETHTSPGQDRRVGVTFRPICVNPVKAVRLDNDAGNRQVVAENSRHAQHTAHSIVARINGTRATPWLRADRQLLIRRLPASVWSSLSTAVASDGEYRPGGSTGECQTERNNDPRHRNACRTRDASQLILHFCPLFSFELRALSRAVEDTRRGKDGRQNASKTTPSDRYAENSSKSPHRPVVIVAATGQA